MDETLKATPAADDQNPDAAADRRAVLKKFGRFAGVTAPAVTLLLAASAKPAAAAGPAPTPAPTPPP